MHPKCKQQGHLKLNKTWSSGIVDFVLSVFLVVFIPGMSHQLTVIRSNEHTILPVADPGFPVGGRRPSKGGALTPEAVTFQKFCMLKRKNLDPWGLCLAHAP